MWTFLFHYCFYAHIISCITLMLNVRDRGKVDRWRAENKIYLLIFFSQVFWYFHRMWLVFVHVCTSPQAQLVPQTHWTKFQSSTLPSYKGFIKSNYYCLLTAVNFIQCERDLVFIFKTDTSFYLQKVIYIQDRPNFML